MALTFAVGNPAESDCFARSQGPTLGIDYRVPAEQRHSCSQISSFSKMFCPVTAVPSSNGFCLGRASKTFEVMLLFGVIWSPELARCSNMPT